MIRICPLSFGRYPCLEQIMLTWSACTVVNNCNSQRAARTCFKSTNAKHLLKLQVLIWTKVFLAYKKCWAFSVSQRRCCPQYRMNVFTPTNAPGADIDELPNVFPRSCVPYVHILPQGAQEMSWAGVVLSSRGHVKLLRLMHSSGYWLNECMREYKGTGRVSCPWHATSSSSLEEATVVTKRSTYIRRLICHPPRFAYMWNRHSTHGLWSTNTIIALWLLLNFVALPFVVAPTLLILQAAKTVIFCPPTSTLEYLALQSRGATRWSERTGLLWRSMYHMLLLGSFVDSVEFFF